MIRMPILICACLSAAGAAAHHSVQALYDFDDVREIEGTIVDVRWINPHVRIDIETSAGERWALDASAINTLERNGIGRDLFQVGEGLTGIGPVARNGRRSMVAAAVRLSDGRYVTMFALIAAELGLEVNTSIRRPGADAAAADTSSGLFRVWFPRSRPRTGARSHDWPLADAARRAKEAYDPLTDDPALDCVAAGMPVILDTPYPVEFSRRDGDIVIRFEEWDGVRTIHMSGGAGETASPMGFSVGQWDGDTLVVRTRNIGYPYFDDVGTPQSGQSEIVERYSLSDGDRRLDWEATITDPQVFTEPVTLAGHMEWVPGERIKPFDCTLVR